MGLLSTLLSLILCVRQHRTELNAIDQKNFSSHSLAITRDTHNGERERERERGRDGERERERERGEREREREKLAP